MSEKKARPKKVIPEKQMVSRQIVRYKDNAGKQKDGLRMFDAFNYNKRIRVNAKRNITIDECYKRIVHYSTEFQKDDFNVFLVNVYFHPKDKNDKSILCRTINAKYLTKKDKFEKRLFDTIKGNIEGSDGIDEENFFPSFKYFELILVKQQSEMKAYGDKFKKEFFITKKTPDGEDCVNYVLRNIHKKYKGEVRNNTLKEIIDYITEKDLNVAIISNGIASMALSLLSFQGSDIIEVDGIDYKPLKNIKYSLGYLHGDEKKKYDYYIVFDCVSEHCEYNDKLEIRDIYVDARKTYYTYQDGKMKELIGTLKNCDNNIEQKITVKESIPKTRFLFFDYETITDWEHDTLQKPYSICFFDLSEEDMKYLDRIDESEDKEALEEFIKEHAKFKSGFNCSKYFLEYIKKNGHNTVFKLVSFNGANFDNFILYNDCIKHNIDQISEPTLSNGQLLTFKIFGRHHPWDIKKHIAQGSLKDLGDPKSFNLKLCAKREGYSHQEAQDLYDNDRFDEILNDKKLFDYNIYDCLALIVISERYRKAMAKIFPEPEYQVFEHMTLGSLMMAKFNNHIKTNNISLPKFKEKENDKTSSRNANLYKFYTDLMDNRVAGRVQLFNGILKIEGHICSPDVCSLYPYVMSVAPVYYPSGEIIEVKSYIPAKHKDYLGFYYCDIDQSDLEVNIIAKKNEDGNDWDFKEPIKNMLLSSPIIEYAIKIGAKIKIKNGFYFTEKIKSCNLFEFLLEIMKLKNIQDTYKESKDPKYNSVLREVYKLCLNILSGKLNQKINTSERKILSSAQFADLANSKKIDNLNTLMVAKGKIHITYDVEEIDRIIKAKPVYIGTLIYDYAKIYMHEHQYSKTKKENLIYTDTDSNKLRKKDFEEWTKYATKITVPHWKKVEKYDERYKDHKLYNEKSKVFGSFEDEYKKNPNELSYFLQKKVYYVHGKFDKPCFHFKGISDKDIILAKKTVLTKDKKKIEHTQKELYDIYNDPNNTRIKKNHVKFFEKLYKKYEKNGEATQFILSSSLQKVSNNTKKGVKPEEEERHNKICYNIRTAFRIKKITITNEKNKKI